MRFEKREGFLRPFPLFILADGIDTEISCGGARHPTFWYRRPGLSFEMTGSRDLRGVSPTEWPRTDIDMRLGPVCVLGLNRRSLSRDLAPEDYPRIAADFKEALSHYLELPGSKPPPIERVTFLDTFLAPYSD